MLEDLPPTSSSNDRFLLWELIFGRPSLGRSTPPSNCYFTDSLSDSSYFMPTLRVHIWQTKYWHIYPPPWMAISQIPALTAHISSLVWELIFGRLCVGRSYPPLNGNFTDSCSDSLYFIPTLRTHIWQTKCWQIYPPWMKISLVPALTAHISFLLWELIFGRPVVDRSIPPSNGDFTDCCSDTSYFIPSLRAHIWQTRCWQINSLHQIAIIDSYFESSYLADQVLADPPLSSWQFHILLF